MTVRDRPGLLVSVRSAEEARRALAGGATLIDVKEPARGALGRADDAVIAAIVEAVAGHVPVSAALGELSDDDLSIPEVGLTYIKWGLASCRLGHPWRERLRPLLNRTEAPRVVVAAYADAECAAAPDLDAVLALTQPGGVLLLDTHCKEVSTSLGRRPTLLDWLPLAEIEAVVRSCRTKGVQVALAGSLGFDEIAALRGVRPDWFAVRGAVCEGGREGRVDPVRVSEMAEFIRDAS